MDNVVRVDETQEYINDRLVIIVDFFEKGKKAAFARKVGISPQAAQEMLAGRRSEPSFKALVKILQSYPQVRTDWLVLGQGPMLRDTSIDWVKTPIYATKEQFEQASRQREESDAIMAAYMDIAKPELSDQIKRHKESEKAKATAEQEAIMRIYSVGETRPEHAGNLLSVRLGISENEALQLVTSGKIRGSDFGMQGFANGYRVTELAVREFLGESVTYISPWSLPLGKGHSNPKK